MRKIFLIIILLMSTICSGQFGDNPFSFYTAPTNSPVVFTYNVRAQAFFDTVKVHGQSLSELQKRCYDSIFVRLTDSALIGSTPIKDSISSAWCFTLRIAPNEVVAKLDLLGRYHLVNVNGVVFGDSGIKGNGTSSYLKTGFIPKSDSSIYKLLSGSVSAYSQKVGNAGISVGNYNSTSFTLLYGGASVYTAINCTGGGTPLANGGSSLGFYTVTRCLYQNYFVYKNGVNVGHASIPQVSASSLEVEQYYILAMSNSGVAASFSTELLSWVVIKSGLSNTKERMLSNIINSANKQKQLNVY
jgi:hypothetical protein